MAKIISLIFLEETVPMYSPMYIDQYIDWKARKEIENTNF